MHLTDVGKAWKRGSGARGWTSTSQNGHCGDSSSEADIQRHHWLRARTRQFAHLSEWVGDVGCSAICLRSFQCSLSSTEYTIFPVPTSSGVENETGGIEGYLARPGTSRQAGSYSFMIPIQSSLTRRSLCFIAYRRNRLPHPFEARSRLFRTLTVFD